MSESFSALTDWCKKNKTLLLMTVIIYQAVTVAIGIVNFPYMDDTVRQRVGNTDFASTYSRWGSELASWFVQGSRHLTDMGLFTHILTGFILTVASVIVVFTLNNKKLSALSLIVSTLIGLNPWFLQSISFRFDSPYMALSILFSVLPFLWWESKARIFFILSAFSILMMCNTYQASSGIYIVMVLALSLKTLLAGGKIGPVLKKSLLSAGAYIVAMIAYLIETKFNPDLANRGGNVAIAAFKDIPKTLVANISMYLHSIIDQSTKVWMILFVLLIVLFIVVSFVQAKERSLSLLFIGLYLVLGAILSYGVFLIFPEKLALAAPRYAYGFSVFTAITLILLLDHKLSPQWKNMAIKGTISLFCYYLLSFPFVYASALHYQKDAFVRQSMMLAISLKNLVTANTKQVYATMLFKDSPVFNNTKQNYPILQEMVPPNSAIFFPNQVVFKTYTGMDIMIESFDFATFDKEHSELKSSDYYYDIYEKDNQLYVLVK
ncbi:MULTISPECIES: glucosyltransferase domain-containing protein [unclassified Enterococcus]|uniref:glucosyltransferase domain-containing protein n=1 Tax=unclassified Enterococcus TaxID=2608891 RepID=UPI001CE191AB|nr:MULTISPECIES: glucosyltransferase domain-containing protein [unclassified Enterococcus]MCA5014171.1 glucosyltransferase domain-containing protein [Enterococcus sp. S23]MCA5017609.1 glucosyltransferase domain-containing protein [Enterococcus sp. S22(2020)]